MMAAAEEVTLTCVRLKEAIETRTQELLTQIENNSNKDAIFSFDESLVNLCQTFGTILKGDTKPCPARCHVTGTGTHVSTVDEASYITIHLLTETGVQCTDIDNTPIDVKLMNIHNEIICKGERVKVDNNSVTFRYVPIERGIHYLHVNVLGQPIKDSPFKLTIQMPFKLKCIVQTTLSSFAKPGGLAVGPGGELAVIDSRGYSTVHVYNSNHELVMSTGDWGSGEGQCWEPIGVTFDLSGNLLVVDGGNMRIHKFDRQGKHVMSVGQKGKEKLEFLRPTGIAVNSSGNVYVCDRTNNRIQVLKPNLTFDFTFGSYGTGAGNLYNPWDVAVDSEGFLYVVDAGHRCIKKFTPFGEFLMSIGPQTTGNEKDREVKCLQMLSIDEYDYIYVTDRDAHCVYVFDTSGKYHTKIGVQGTGEGQFWEPLGIVKVKDALYVSEIGNKRVQQFA